MRPGGFAALVMEQWLQPNTSEWAQAGRSTILTAWLRKLFLHERRNAAAHEIR
jgi:hypothetical protein